MPDLRAIWNAGRVLRWHTHPHLAGSGDRLDGHHARVARIILALHPDPSAELLRAALTHDDGESVTGDRPRGNMCIECSNCEIAECEALWDGAPDLNDTADDLWLAMADSLDAYLWAKHHAPQIMSAPEWTAHRDEVIALASALQVGRKVREALDG